MAGELAVAMLTGAVETDRIVSCKLMPFAGMISLVIFSNIHPSLRGFLYFPLKISISNQFCSGLVILMPRPPPPVCR
jgi:hypothetical protein